MEILRREGGDSDEGSDDSDGMSVGGETGRDGDGGGDDNDSGSDGNSVEHSSRASLTLFLTLSKRQSYHWTADANPRRNGSRTGSPCPM